MCVQEFPGFESKIWRPYEDSGVIVLGLSEEDFNRVDGFGRDNNISFPLLLHNSSINPYGVPLDGNFAVEVVLDRRGNVAYAGVGSTADGLIPIIESVL